MADISVDIAGIKLKNPLIAASGTYGAGREYDQLVDISNYGAICVKTLTLKPVRGNRPPRLCETPSGMLNSIGLQNPGVESFLENDLPWLSAKKVPIIVSIAGSSVDDCARMAKIVSSASDIAAIELNISCPNIKAGGAVFGSDIKLANEVVAKTRMATSKPLIVKLTPNVGNIADIARTCERAGADALSLINTVLAMSIDVRTRRPRIGSVVGGLSGPAIRPIAVRMVWEVRNNTTVPIIGSGGIMTAQDALEFMIAGATGVALGTVNFINPRAPIEILDGLQSYLDLHENASISEIVGSLRQ